MGVKKKSRNAAQAAELAKRYAYRVFWSDDDQEFVATCAEFPSLSGLGGSQEDALREAQVAVRGSIEWIKATSQSIHPLEAWLATSPRSSRRAGAGHQAVAFAFSPDLRPFHHLRTCKVRQNLDSSDRNHHGLTDDPRRADDNGDLDVEVEGHEFSIMRPPLDGGTQGRGLCLLTRRSRFKSGPDR